MKVIDLLNKIANGEEVPKEIKYDTMNYVFRHYDYKEVYGELIDEQSSWLEKIDFYKLNDEVEIIEEDKKIKHLENYVDFANLKDDEKFDYLYEMESRIIDYLDKGE